MHSLGLLSMRIRRRFEADGTTIVTSKRLQATPSDSHLMLEEGTTAK